MCIFLCVCPMKYIAQSVPIFTMADLTEYRCFSDVLLFPCACSVLLNLRSAAFHSGHRNTTAIASTLQVTPPLQS